jgi:dTDP-4-dehydrorhamnose reductase
MNKILIIGKKSFLGSNLKIQLSKKFDTDIFSFEKIISKDLSFFNKYTHIINTSIHPNYINKKYNKKFDLDHRLIKRFKKIDFFYIFLNSRKIYLPKDKITEKSELKPKKNYEKNKIITETYLQRNIKNKLISLRISNVLGNRLFKSTRHNHRIFFDNFLILKKRKSLTVNNDFKDFITIDQFCKIIGKIVEKNIHGIFNVSLGKKIFISEIVNWIDKTFYKRIKFIKKQNDSFTLSNKKLLTKIQITITKNQVKTFCKKLM